MSRKTFYVYIMASQRNGTLYTGMTSDLEQRVYDHREGPIDSFTKQYDVKMLVWYEDYPDPGSAIQREKNIKKWPRQWKLDLIEKFNPDWKDLYEEF